MKKSTLVFLVTALVLTTVMSWLIVGLTDFTPTDIWQLAIILLVVVFALYVGFTRLSSERRGEPAEDELSKHLLLKTAAYSYYISLYLWVVILYVKDRIAMDMEEWIGTGILGMAVSFGISYLVVRLHGVKN